MNKSIPKEKKSKKAKWSSQEALQIAQERGEAKKQGRRERYIQLNTDFQRTAWRAKKTFFNEQCINERKTTEGERLEISSKKLEIIKQTFCPKMGTIKDINGNNLVDGEEIEKRWKEYMEELYKKDLNELYCYYGVVKYPMPDIMKGESSGP